LIERYVFIFYRNVFFILAVGYISTILIISVIAIALEFSVDYRFFLANPNCSTIQMVLALAPLHKKHNIKRVIVSTYQSITGTGVNAV